LSDEYVRVFCTSAEIPTINEVLNFVASKGIQLKVSPGSETDTGTTPWGFIYLSYQDEQPAFTARLIITTNSAPEDELGDFIDAIEDVAEGIPGQHKVLQHLKATKYYVSILLSTNFEKRDWQAIAHFLSYFTTLCGGMIQNDAEGFYDGRKILLNFRWKS
jgi:hypothetical protein